MSEDAREVAGPFAARVRDLHRGFDRPVLRGLDLDLRAGEFVCLLGASGCGKSTLLRILADLDHAITGEVQVAERRAVVFQQPRLLPWKRVWRNVVLGLDGETRGRVGRERAFAVLDEVGLSHRTDVWPKVLSGGEAQRAALARALVRDPQLLLLDEPFAALDALTRIRVRQLVERLWRRHGPAVLMVTHDVEESVLLADRVLVMVDGVIVHDLTVPADRPRSVSDPELVSLRANLLAVLGVDGRGEAA